MRIRFLLFSFLFFCFLSTGFAQERKMSPAEVASFQKLMAHATQVKTLTADFTQYKKLGYVKKELVSSGKFYVKNPDKLAWFYKNPTPYTLIFKDKKMFLEEKGKKKTMDLSRNEQFEKISRAIQLNMGGSAYKDSEFAPSYYQTSKHYILKLDPTTKDVKKSIKQLLLFFDKSNQLISEITLIDNANGVTRYVFTNQKVNGAVADALFDL